MKSSSVNEELLLTQIFLNLFLWSEKSTLFSFKKAINFNIA